MEFGQCLMWGWVKCWTWKISDISSYLSVQFHETLWIEQMNYPLDFVGMELFGIPKESLCVLCVCVKPGSLLGKCKGSANCMVLRVFGFEHVDTFLKRDTVNRTQTHQTRAKTHNAYPDRNSSKALTSSFIVQASDRFCFSYFIYLDTRTLYPPLPVGCFLLARSPTTPLA